MKILMLGVGDFFSRRYYSSSFVLLYDNRTLLVDCPDPIRRMLYDASQLSGLRLDLKDLNDVIVTHLHGDHSNGLESLAYYKRFVEKRRPTIYTIPEVADNLWEHKLKASMHYQQDLETGEPQYSTLEDYFKLSLLKPGIVNTVKGLKIQIRYTRHFIPCFGLKIAYGGRCLGYSSDTAFDPEHIAFLSDCDLIFHESNLGGHTPYEKLLELPIDIRKKMLVVHVHDDFDVKNGSIHCAREGAVYEL